MKIVFFAHPSFLVSQSMPRYATWLAEGMTERGHNVEIWRPIPRFYKMKAPASFKKWLGYIDQYVLFPRKVKKLLKKQEPDTLFVFTDHALGPWVPLVDHLPHIVHCHDFLAQRSALGEIPQNPTGFTGRLYQKYIRNGFQKGKNFVSVSKRTAEDLLIFLSETPRRSAVVYNGMTSSFTPSANILQKRNELSAVSGIDLSNGFLLHVGGNQWYKNRAGVIRLYDAWRKQTSAPLPLVMVGAKPTEKLKEIADSSPFKNDIHFQINVADSLVKDMYLGASLLIFPSYAEGFGWPIIEAMASGCPVAVCNDTPMTEIGGDAAIYLDMCPQVPGEVEKWADASAVIIDRFITASDDERNNRINAGFNNIKRFDASLALDKIEQLYLDILKKEQQ
jgi:glycosyltransferase involved in cell wall biosynthesis